MYNLTRKPFRKPRRSDFAGESRQAEWMTDARPAGPDLPPLLRKDRHMRMRRLQNVGVAGRSRAEGWMLAHLLGTGLSWVRQKRMDGRLFDFFSPRLWLAVEVDGPEHDAAADAARDLAAQRAGVTVLRIGNFDEAGAARAVSVIGFLAGGGA